MHFLISLLVQFITATVHLYFVNSTGDRSSEVMVWTSTWPFLLSNELRKSLDYVLFGRVNFVKFGKLSFDLKRLRFIIA